MILTDLIPEKTYLVDVGFSFKYKMQFIAKVADGLYNFLVKEHFMDTAHENWEVGNIYPCNSKNDIYELEPNIPSDIRKELMDSLGMFWNKFMTIEYQKTYSSEIDNKDFCDAINTCQRILATQQLRHIQPKFFE